MPGTSQEENTRQPDATTRSQLIERIGLRVLEGLADLLAERFQTSVAIFPANGECSTVRHPSPWCRLMRDASRPHSEDDIDAMSSGQWVCHESCRAAARAAIDTNAAATLPCFGGMREHAVPIRVNGRAIGSITIGLGGPPTAPTELDRISAALHLPRGELLQAAEASRPEQPSDATALAEYLSSAIQVLELILSENDREGERSRSRERFVSMVTHDLRSPLTAARLSTDVLLRAGNLTPYDAGVIDRLRRSLERMTRLVEQLLDVSRIQSGSGIQLRVRRVDLGRIGREMAAELEDAHPGTVVKVTAADVLWVKGDETRLQEVVANLLENARRYGEPGKPIALAVEDGGSEVLLLVHNLGAPIPPEILPILFDPFNEAKQRLAQTGRREGLGLGLYIVREIVAGHGGTIDVRSSQAEGTTFTVHLPRDIA